jgi:thiol:disulfide interchange protein
MKSHRVIGWMVLGAIALVALAIVAVPVMLIRPFAPQTPATVGLAFTLRRWSPLVTLGLAVIAVWPFVRLWGQTRRAGRVGASVLGLLVLGAAWFARQNYFEWMFRPLADPRFVRTGAADFVRPDDMVLAVRLGQDAVAYPVPQLAYHHLVEDRVGGVPIVATY